MTNITPSIASIKCIRQRMRRRRRMLHQRSRRYAAFCAARFLNKLVSLLPKNARIGLYLDSFGEMPTQPIFKFCHRYGYQTFLPITYANQPLKFAPVIHQKTKIPFKKHPLGMYEPIACSVINASQLDAIICPLVAVDRSGVRLGMGGGYYDRTLSQIKTRCLIIAWCYDFQVVNSLPKQVWDMPVDIIITDRRLIRIT